jgi:hypothetical protein
MNDRNARTPNALASGVCQGHQELTINLCLRRVITPRMIKAHPIARIKKSAGMSIAQISFTVPAYKNNIERKTNAMPVMVSPLILSK